MGHIGDALRERTAVIVTLAEEVHLSCFQVVDCSHNLYSLRGVEIAKDRAIRSNRVDRQLLAATASTKAKFFDERSPLKAVASTAG
jgi:hypothetical protein